jgi:DNA polymerase I-like protein with 3'-5' exonuclease and polymerase domains
MTYKIAPRPNVRALFLPDPGPDEWVIVDADLSGADAGVVAWETNDQALKESFRSGISLHNYNASKFWQSKYDTASGDTKNKRTLKGRMYADIKGATHGTNYGASGRTVAINLGWPIKEGERFREFWYREHPGVLDWHKRTERQLYTNRRVTNAFGYRMVYFDRIAGLLPQALAWVPQSTVALCTFMGARQVDDTYNPERDRYNIPIPNHPNNKVTWLLQVHDSLVFQIRKKDMHLLPAIAKALEVVIPYEDPLIIPWSLATSDKSWGECTPWKNAA